MSDTIPASWISLFRLYDNLPALRPAWFQSLRENGEPQTGSNTVDASIKEAFTAYAK